MRIRRGPRAVGGDRPLFWIDTAAEWVLGSSAVFALAHFGRYSLISQFLGVIIGCIFCCLLSY
jgi:hypothetical protein